MPFKSSKLSFLLVLVLVFTSAFVSAPSVNAVSTLSTVYPQEISSVLNNPYMGWAPWASGGPYSQPHKLVYVNATWRELEPTKGVYAFDALETKNKFSYWASQGVKVIMRINMDYPRPTSHMDIPDWLYKEINGDGTWYDIDWGKGFSPNYSNPKLIAYHKMLIGALAARYNNDKRVPIIAIGSLGHWGEFHTKKSSTFTIPFPGVNITDQYVQHYVDSFKNKTLIIRRPFKIAKDNGMGLFNDSFGSYNQTYTWFLDYVNKGYTDWLTGETHPSMPDYWKTAPSGGEFPNYPGLTYLDNSNINTTLQMVRDSHTSWLGPCSPGLQPTGTNLQPNFDLVLNTMGYRFVLKNISHLSEVNAGQSLTVNMNWINRGVAPFYYKWPLELSLVDLSGQVVFRTNTQEDIRSWLPGSKSMSHDINIPVTVPAGTYTLCAAIIDPETGKPGIDLAISGRRPDGRYTLSQLKVNHSPSANSVAINGATYINIPTGEVTYSDYSAVVYDQYGNTMNNQPVNWSLLQPVEGVTLDSITGKIIVGKTAKPYTMTLKGYIPSNPAVYATKTLNLIYEKPAASSIEVSGATYVKIPSSGVTYSDYIAVVKDQYQNTISGETVSWSLDKQVSGVTLDSSKGKIVVYTNAPPSTLTLKAVSNSRPEVSTTKTIIFIH
ncbi:MAG: DUF4832 domain-containing protein [Bacillota bacterium]